MNTLKKYGLLTTLFMLKRKIKNLKSNYDNYLKNEDANTFDLPPLKNKPLISVILYADKDITSCLNSVKNQTNYDNFEIIVVSPKAIKCEGTLLIIDYDSDKNKAFKTGLKAAKGDYVCFCDSSITLAPYAFYYMTRQLIYNDYDIIYSDEDVIDNGTRTNPFFKPSWSPDTLRSFNYIGFALIKKSLIQNFTDCYTLFKELSYENINVSNVEKILVHTSNYSREETPAESYGGNALISIIIPSKDNYAVLKRCIDSIREKTLYKNYEIIVVDNGSSENIKDDIKKLADKYIYDKYDFNFSLMCNTGALNSKGEFLLFLNDDTEIVSPDWLTLMTACADKPLSGAVGCKLLYPNTDKIQHCGIINIQNGPVHCFQGYDTNDSLYFGRNKYNYNYSSVTGACLLIKRDRFKGFDENFPVAYNDVDLCLTLVEKGYYNTVVNSVKIYHYESLSRGNDIVSPEKLKKLYSAGKQLKKKHPQLCFKDKFYNRNLTYHKADFSFELPEYINRGRFAKAVIDPEKYLSDKINFNIDCVAAGDITSLGGYAYIKGTLTETYVLIFTRTNIAVPIKANTELRNDIALETGNKTLNLCGFSANIDTCLFEKGSYTIGIMLINKITRKKYIALSNKKLNVL